MRSNIQKLSLVLILLVMVGCSEDANQGPPTNSAPNACFEVQPLLGTPDTEFTFDASCTTDNEDGHGDLRFAWDWNGDNAFDDSYPGQPTVTHQFAEEGSYEVILLVTDSGNSSGRDTLTVSVTSEGELNTFPTACFSVDPPTGLTTTVFNFDAGCSEDAEDVMEDLRFSWDWDADNVFDETYTGIPLAVHQFPNEGEFPVYLRVFDSGGLSGRDTVVVTVSEFLPDPFVEIAAGEFMMGAPVDEPGADYDEMPQHSVTLTNPYLMSSTEVTNQQFADLAQWAYDNDYVLGSPLSLRDAFGPDREELLDLDDPDCEIKFDYVVIGGDTTGFISLKSESRRNHPVKEVTWFGAVAYCDWLSIQEGLDPAYDHDSWECNGGDPYGAEGYRLPTEAEWEYACRAGSQTAFANGDIGTLYCDTPESVDEFELYSLYEIGWYCGNSDGRTHSAAQLIPNAWGLYDMHGNVWEWCNDWFGKFYYSEGPGVDPPGPVDGTEKVLRGGFFSGFAETCRSAARPMYTARSVSQDYVGFRIVKTAD